MKNLIKMLIVLLPFLQFSQASAQFDPDSLFKAITAEYEKEYEDFKKRNEEIFNNFVKENDKSFAEFLKTAWKEQSTTPPKPAPDKPKPKTIPQVKQEEIKNNKQNEIKIVQQTIAEQTQPEDSQKPKDPGIQTIEPKDFETFEHSFQFYSATINLKYDKRLQQNVSQTINENAIAEYWIKTSETNHYHLINQLLDYKRNLGLNDWGYFMLVQKTAQEIIGADQNTQNLFAWFILNKSRYKVKIGFNENNIFLLVATQQMIFEKPYFNFDNTNYFLIGKRQGKLYTYSKDYPDAKTIMNLNLNKALNLPEIPAENRQTIVYNNDEHTFVIKYNKANMDFYNDYPFADIKIYFDAALGATAKETLISQIAPIVGTMNETDAINFLLRYVQTGFKYKTDGEQFGHEKFFFPEEIFFYPFSDCEDRSVIFAFLVNQLLNLEVVGLEYPGHMATAVAVKNTDGADFFIQNNKKYIICDPTYAGAPLGMCMPQYLDIQGKVIELKNKKTELKTQSKLWSVLQNAGAYGGGAEKNTVFDNQKNAYIAGYFTGELKIDQHILKTNNQNSEAFVAKFDSQNNCLWIKQTTSTANTIGNYINIDKHANVYFSGTFEKSTKIDNFTLTTQDQTGLFVAKISPTGQTIWANTILTADIKNQSDNIYYAGFDPNGKFITSVLFEENENFENYGIHITPDGNCLVTLSYNTSNLEMTEIMSKTIESATSFNHGNLWKAEYDRLVSGNCDPTIAGLFAFIKTIKVNGSTVSGKAIMEALDTFNPDFKKSAPQVYSTINKIDIMKNNGGIITLQTKNKENIDFAELRMTDNTRFNTTTYQGGNAQINIISGATVGKAVIRFNLNFIKMIKETGDLIIDYDVEHSQKKINLQKDILD